MKHFFNYNQRLILCLLVLLSSHYRGVSQPSVIASSNSTTSEYTTRIDITTQDFTDLTKMEFSLQWDDQVIKLKSLKFPETSLNLSIMNLDTTVNQNGVLTFSWENTSGATLADETTLFSINFTAIGTAPSQSDILFVESPLSFTVNRLNNGNINIGLFTISGSVQITNNCRTLDSLSLVSVYQSTHENGAWTNEWDLSQPINTWYGVGLNDQGCVDTLDLDGIIDANCISCSDGGNNLAGTLSDSLWLLQKLTYLSLTGNQQIAENNIPSTIECLSDLTVLSLGAMNLKGIIPNELDKLNNLNYLYLNDNELSGIIPSGIGNLSLIDLFLNNNKFSGDIPAWINNIQSLQELHLSENFFSTCPEFNNLPNLQNLYLNNNLLTFEDLIKNKGKATQNYLYYPQNLFSIEINDIRTGCRTFFEGSEMILKFPYDDTLSSNQYKWFKDNNLETQINGDNTNNIGSATNSLDGGWHCQITNTALPNLTLQTTAKNISITSESPVIFKSETIIGNKDDIFCMDVVVEGFDSIIFYSFAHTWDTSKIEFIELKNNNLLGNGFAYSVTSKGVILTFFFDFVSFTKSLPDKSVIYQVCYRLKETTNEGFQVSFDDTPNFVMEFLQFRNNNEACINPILQSGFSYSGICNYNVEQQETLNSDSHIFQASNSIKAIDVIKENVLANYSAGNTITFLPGTHFESGSMITAQIKPCEISSLIELYDNESFLKVQSIVPLISSVNIFPNPTQDFINIQVKKEAEGFQAVLFDLMGRQLKKWQFGQNNAQIFISEVPAGVYFLNIDGIHTKRLIISQN